MYFSRREQVIIIFIIILIFLISIFNYISNNLLAERDINSEEVEEILKEMEETDNDEAGYIIVHVSGEVYNPGIVELKAGSRVIDAINLAGGLKKDADSDKINLARKLSDEEKIHVPKIGEDISADLSSSYLTSSGEGKININICTKEELISLPGVGEALAERIIEYRKHSPFKTIEEIMNVSGIGSKKFESIKDLITVK
ncbi:helix-hairpin-helix domain-containing protein [Tepidimicrobium xylanilyticum]|uniref:Competence protein ComEA n=1 Tax=Tepidimicrobium xylanilyticum TaxID=1123352 RepID=A0A1H3BRF2_9FIRM|nr:helix-hairpin-helix domain-containing protein [Tepidimicrobium xylanilyticum]GMG97235.1 hypothetical protein EN5CB1_20610 [Tepidimicrobium xylanilyticum]SDX44523.1 competence protein ComEA [Tepidimicrobium xylanilyticum]